MSDRVPHPTTAALHTRLDDEELGAARATTTPLFQSSAFRSGSPYFYSRKSNPNVVELERFAATLEGAREAVATSTGMSALALCFSLLRPDDTVVISQLVYGCSFRQAHRLAERGAFKLEVRDLCGEGDLDLPDDVGMVLFETPTNPFLRSVDIARAAAAAKAKRSDALVVVDNTWATPVFQQPLAHGADLSVMSATKYVSGHSDVMGGLVTTDTPLLAERMREERFYSGAVLDPHSAWLLRRSGQTMPLRLAAQAASLERIARFLGARPEVARVHLPEVDGHQLKGYACILFFELASPWTHDYERLATELELFDTGTGMAAVTSMIAQPWSGSHASLADDEKRDMGLSPALVRLCIGLEDAGDLEADLDRALSRLPR
jgi:cystathionine gamma-lyase/cystathionine gamma-lyase/homocysteine desulfhydrase